jgi:hypothetical protein
MPHKLTFVASLSVLAFAAGCSAGSGGSSGTIIGQDGGLVVSDSGTQTPTDGSTVDGSSRFGPDGGPPDGRVPMTNGAFIYDDGAVAWWNTGTFTLSRGSVDPNESSLGGSFQTTAVPGAIDPQLKGRREGDCAMLKGQSTPGFPAKTTEPAGTLTLSVINQAKATVAPSAEGRYLRSTPTSWFQPGDTLQLSFAGGPRVPGLAIDLGRAPPMPPSFVAPTVWAKSAAYVVTFPPLSQTGNLLIRSSVGSGSSAMLLECEAPLSKGQVQIPVSMRADIEAQWKDTGGAFMFEVLTRTSVSTWSQGWLLAAEAQDERGTPGRASTTFAQ